MIITTILTKYFNLKDYLFFIDIVHNQDYFKILGLIFREIIFCQWTCLYAWVGLVVYYWWVGTGVKEEEKKIILKFR